MQRVRFLQWFGTEQNHFSGSNPDSLLTLVETEAITWRIDDTDCIEIQLEREIYCIMSHEQMQCKKELSIRLIEFEASWMACAVQNPRKTNQQCVIHFRYPEMHLVSHIPESTKRMSSDNNFTTDISEWLHISNVKGAD